MSEASEQTTVVQWCDLKGIPIFHIPNGGSRDKREAANLKRQGVKAGVPDLCVPVAAGKYHSLYIEMKDDKGKPTEKQIEWLYKLREQGMCAYICYGARNAITLMFWSSDNLTGSQTNRNQSLAARLFWSSDNLTGSQTALIVLKA